MTLNCLGGLRTCDQRKVQARPVAVCPVFFWFWRVPLEPDRPGQDLKLSKLWFGRLPSEPTWTILPSFHLSIHPSIDLPIRSSIPISIHLPIHPSALPSIHLSIHPTTHTVIHQSIHPCIHSPMHRHMYTATYRTVCYGWRVGIVKSIVIVTATACAHIDLKLVYT